MFREWLHALWFRLKALVRRQCLEQDLDDELQFHLAMRQQQLVEHGMSPEEARYAARRAFGNQTQTKESNRELWSFPFLETLWQDLRYGLHQLRRNPGFTAVAVLTLALGIGASTGMFSVIDAVMLRPLPFPHPDQLMAVLGLTQPGEAVDPLAWWGHNRSFDQLASCASGGVNLAVTSQAERIPVAVVSASFFPVLEVRPMLGRGFLPDEEIPGQNRVAVLSYGLWAEAFGRERKALGQAIRLNGIPYTVVGVMPAGFSFPDHARVWVPRVAPTAPSNAGDTLDLGSDPAGLRAQGWNIGRLRAGVSIAQAEAEMTLLAHRLQDKFGDTHHIVANEFIAVRPLQEMIVGNVRPALLALFGAVVFVLLIACANVANMLLGRAAVRQKEIAVRLSLGASGRRVVRQLLTESLLLAAVGGSLGVMLTSWIIDAIRAIAPINTPRLENITVDARVLAFALFVSVVTGLFVGLAPALQSLSPRLSLTLQQEGYQPRGTMRAWVRSVLVIGEVALAAALLSGAGLMLRSFYDLTHIKLGFNPRHLLTTELDLPATKRAPEAKAAPSKAKPGQKSPVQKGLEKPSTLAHSGETSESAESPNAVLFQRILEETRSLPGVAAVGAVSNLVLTRENGYLYFDVGGRPTGVARVFGIGGDYFRAMQIPLIAGRAFTDKDTGNAPKVVIISQSLAHAVWGNKNPVGDQLLIEAFGETPREIVGVAGDVTAVESRGTTQWRSWDFYLPYSQEHYGPHPGQMALVVRTVSDPRGITSALKSRVLSVDKDLPLFDVRPMEEVVSEYAAPQRFRGLLLGVFALLAVVLTGVGVYGVMSYSAAVREHEIGIRMALGAQKADVLGMVLLQGLKVAVVGVVIGIAGALALTRFLSSLLYGVKPTDPLTFIAVSLLLIAVALVACYIPARRAAKVDPMVALRYE